MRLRLLGSSAGGGLPQWNCACPMCAMARINPARVGPRQHCSLAFSGLGKALEHNSESFRARALLGRVLRDLGKAKEALAELDAVIREAPALMSARADDRVAPFRRRAIVEWLRPSSGLSRSVVNSSTPLGKPRSGGITPMIS